MIVTLVAQTKRFQEGLSDAGKRAQMFGGIVGGAMNLALGAIGLLAGAIIFFLPNFIKLGEEARKSELRLQSIAKTTGLFGDETEAVTRKVSKYAEQLSFLTGVDDELIRGNQAVLLTFKDLAKTAGTVGGAFDRATVAALDLSAAGLGDAESSAIQLGKALQDPVNGLTALRRAGVTFTDAEKEKIRVLVESNRTLEAQDAILTAIEGQVGGTAVAIASATDKMSARFESVAEELSLALLPAVDDIAASMIDWLDSVEGKNAVKDLTKQLIDFGKWIASPEGKQAIDDLVGSLKIMADVLNTITKFLIGATKAFADFNAKADYYGQIDSGLPFIPGPPRPAPATPPTNNRDVLDRLNVTINGVVSGPATTRIVTAAVKEGKRLGMRSA
jgi:hypothetical protein